MKRHFEALRSVGISAPYAVPDGYLMVRIEHAQFHWHKRKPYYEFRFAVLKPKYLMGRLVTARLYCTAKEMWKLSWFLKEFGYDADLLARAEIDDHALVDLWGVVKVSHATAHGVSILNFDGFASAERWEELASNTIVADDQIRDSEVAS